MYGYRERTASCSGCEDFDFSEHTLYHKTGVSSAIIRELRLSSVEKVKNKFLFPKNIIDLIPNLEK